MAMIRAAEPLLLHSACSRDLHLALSSDMPRTILDQLARMATAPSFDMLSPPSLEQAEDAVQRSRARLSSCRSG